MKNRQVIDRWKKEMKNSPEGSLHCVVRSGRRFYYNRCGGRRIGITKDEELIYSLARKRYLSLLISTHERAMSSGGEPDALPLRELLDYYICKGLDPTRITCSKEQYIWMSHEYRANTLNPEERVYETYSGLGTRSKSEQSIGKALERYGVPYRYEPELRLDIGWMEGVNARYKSYYPDFVILAADGSKILWEHLGRVDRSGYRSHNMEKIAAYRQGLGIDERQLILTFESDLRQPETLDSIIERRVLPYV